MSQADHRLNILVTTTGLDSASQQVNSFGQATSGLVSRQDALQGALGKTQGAALKTGQEFSNTSQEISRTGSASSTASKPVASLGQAFQSSALQIAAFASGLVSSVGQFLAYQKATTSLERQQALLQTRWLGLEQAEKKLAAAIASGKISADDAQIASDKLAAKRLALQKQTELLQQKEQAHSLSLINLATSIIPTVINGFSSFATIYNSIKKTVDAARTSTDAGGESLDALGTAAETSSTVGLIPMIKNFASWIIGAKGAHSITTTFTGALSSYGQQLTAAGASSNILVRAFTAMGTSIKNFGASIRTDIGGAIGIVDKIKTGFISFFTNIKDGFVAFGSSIKNAITSLGQIKLASIAAFVTNPAFLAITAIAAVIVALSGNMFGFRDSLNGVGKALGDMAPPLKGVLTWIGEAGNAALDAIGGFLGFQKQMDTTGESATQAAQRLGTLYVATQNVFNTQTTQDVDALVTALEGMTAEINNLGTTGTKGIEDLGKQMADFHTKIGEQSPKTEQLFRDFQKALNEAKADGVVYASEVKNIVKVYDELRNSLGSTISVEENAIAAQTGVSKSTTDMGSTIAATQKIIDDYNGGIEAAEQQFKDFAIAYTDGSTDIIAAMGLEEDQITALIDRYNKEYPKGAIVVEQSGQKIIKSVADIQKETTAAAKQMEKDVGDLTKVLQENLPPTLAEIQTAIHEMSQEEKLAAEISKLAATGIYNDKVKLAQAIVDLTKKYGLSKAEAEKALQSIQKETQNQVKEQEKATKSTDDLATAQENAKKYTDAWKTSMDAITQSFATFASKGTSTLSTIGDKLWDIADQAKKAQEEFVSGEGEKSAKLDEYVQKRQELYDQEQEAIGSMSIATAKAGVEWSAWQKMSTEAVNNFAASALSGQFPDAISAIETALDATPDKWKGASSQIDAILNNTALNTRDKANLLAADMGMVENAMKPVQVGAEFVGKAGAEAAAGLDDLAAAALSNVNPMTDMDKAWNTFVSSLSPAQKQLGLVQAVIKGVESGTLTAAEGFQTLESAGVQASKQIGSTVTTSLENLEHQIINLGNGTQATVAKMDGQWVNLGTSTKSNLGPSGAQGEIQNLEGTLTDLGTTATDKLGSEVPTAMSTTSTSANTQFTKVVDYANMVIDIFKVLNNYAKTYLADGIKTSLDRMVAAFQTSIPKIDTIITTTQSKFQTLSTSVAAFATSMIQTINSWITASTTSIGAFWNVIKQTQTLFSTLSTNIATYSKSIITSISAMITSTTTSFGAYMNAVNAVGTTFNTLSTNIGTYARNIINVVTSWITTTTTQFGAYLNAINAVGTTFLTLSTNLATYATNMINTTTSWITATTTQFGAYINAVGAVGTTFGTLSTNIATYSTNLINVITSWIKTTTTQFGAYINAIRSVGTTYGTLSTNIGTYAKSMISTVTSWIKTNVTQFGSLMSSIKSVQNTFSTLSSSVASYMSSMSSKVSSFASSFSSSMSKVKSQADSAAKSVKALQSAINSLKDKSITIHVGLSGPGVGYLAHGGSGLNIPSQSGVSYAAGGKTWLQKNPKKIGNVNVAENFPEIITAIPLDPKEKMSPFHNLEMPLQVPEMPTMAAPVGGGGGNGQQPIQVSGNITTTLVMPDGKVLAKAVNAYLFDNFSGVT